LFIGVEIYFGVMIGCWLFIDYVMGVVIGEMVEVGDDVMFYYGVMFGGCLLNCIKCYFMIGDGVMIGVGVRVFGLIIVGVGVQIGVNLVVVKDVLFGVVVVGVFGVVW